MKNLLALVLISCAVGPVCAATPAKVTTNEFPHTDVATLSDETTINVAADGSFTAARHVRSKILTPRGRRLGEVTVPYNEKYQDIDFHFAKAIKPDGTEQSVRTNDLAMATLFPGHPAYSDVQVMRYRIRGAEVDSIVDQEYVLKAKPVMGDQFWMIWRPRTSQPVFEAKLVLRLPAKRTFQWRAHNVELSPQVTDSADKQWKTYTWTYSDPTEIRAEPYMPSTDELFFWVEISTVNAWNDVAKWLDDSVRPQLDSSSELHDRVASLTSRQSAATDKLAAVFYWVEDNARFVPMDLGLSGYKPRPASQTFQGRYGDAKDLCGLLAAMLNEAGIPARLAFLESGSARPLNNRLPTPRHLTHCIVVAETEGKTYYLDPTAETARFDVTLGRVCNSELLLLGKDANKLVPSPKYEGSKHGTIERAKLQLTASGLLKGQVQTEYLGESDALVRAAMKYARPDQIRTIMEQEVTKNMTGARLIDYEVADASLRSTNFTTTYRFEAPNWATVQNGKIQFKPQLQQEVKLSDELLMKDDRRFPMLFYETAPSRVEIEIELPSGCTVESLPKELELENSFSHWNRTVRQEGQRLLITELSHLKTSRLPKDKTPEIRGYYTEAVARKNELVVLKQK